MDLFRRGQFTLHSGDTSRFKIDCDALSDNEVAALAAELARRLPVFGIVRDCGGASVRIGMALTTHAVAGSVSVVLVDDVLTTGATMEKMRKEIINPWLPGDMGAVLFARGPVPDWITALFTMAPPVVVQEPINLHGDDPGPVAPNHYLRRMNGGQYVAKEQREGIRRTRHELWYMPGQPDPTTAPVERRYTDGTTRWICPSRMGGDRRKHNASPVEIAHYEQRG